jgi:hypothetical protein
LRTSGGWGHLEVEPLDNPIQPTCRSAKAESGKKLRTPTNNKPGNERETLYGVYFRCKRTPKPAADPLNVGDFVELVDEVIYDLSEVERRRLLKLADGMSVEQIASEERVRRLGLTEYLPF